MIERAVGVHMGFVGPDPLGHMLQGQRQWRTGIGAQLVQRGDGLMPARDKARAQAGQVRPFRQRVKDQKTLGVVADGALGDGQPAK